MPASSPAFLVGMALAGGYFIASAAWVLVTSGGHSEKSFQIYAALVLAMAVVEVLVFVSSCLTWVEVSSGRARALVAAGALVFLATVLVGAIVIDALIGASDYRGLILVAAALVAAVPVVASLIALALLSRRMTAGSHVEQLEQVRRAYRSARRLLASAGALVAMTTLSLGAAIIVERDRLAHGDLSGPHYSSNTVIVFGAFGSALVAAAYVPAALAIRGWGERVAAELFPFPLDDADPAQVDGPKLVETLESRTKLTELLGVDSTVWMDLQSGVVILSPLLAAAVTAFLTPT